MTREQKRWCCITRQQKIKAETVGDSKGEVETKALPDSLVYMLA